MNKVELVDLRRDFHRHPETAFQEHRTAEIIADELKALGLDVSTGIAGTGVVGSLVRGAGPAIGLRADMDALPIAELNEFDHRSVNDGVMHGCGHDGHMVMLLGAARRLVLDADIQGIIHFIFQPAEENEGGGRAMIEDGLFERFPMQRIFGLHNWPGLAAGRFAVCPGAIMAAFDTFEIKLKGRGTHAAMPHLGTDVIIAAAQVTNALQCITSRRLDPQHACALSITQVHAGDTWNVLPQEAVLRGCLRYFTAADRQLVEHALREITQNTAAACGVRADIEYQHRYPATVNTAAETDVAAEAARQVVGMADVDCHAVPSMASEDFGFMLQQRPGCYIWLGNGPGDGGCTLHNPRYDFNDRIIETGVAYWVQLARRCLGDK